MVLDKTVACCLTVRDCAIYLTKIFKNLDKLSKHFKNFYVIFVYDNCKDKTPLLLKLYQKRSKSKFKVYVIHNKNNRNPVRTVRISNSRNMCLDVIYNDIKNVDYHIMIDADDVNVKPWDTRVILSSLKRDDWDSISFNRKVYYDIWALLYEKIQHHCWGFSEKSRKIMYFMMRDIKNILNKLKDNELFECYSAFNGFAIYRTEKFKNILYDGTDNKYSSIVQDRNKLSSLQYLKNKLNDNKIIIGNKMKGSCEHLYYHLSAIRDNNVRIRITKWSLNKQLNSNFSEEKYLKNISIHHQKNNKNQEIIKQKTIKSTEHKIITI
jgi:hypothetical protein